MMEAEVDEESGKYEWMSLSYFLHSAQYDNLWSRLKSFRYNIFSLLSDIYYGKVRSLSTLADGSLLARGYDPEEKKIVDIDQTFWQSLLGSNPHKARFGRLENKNNIIKIIDENNFQIVYGDVKIMAMPASKKDLIGRVKEKSHPGRPPHELWATAAAVAANVYDESKHNYDWKLFMRDFECIVTKLHVKDLPGKSSLDRFAKEFMRVKISLRDAGFAPKDSGNN